MDEERKLSPQDRLDAICWAANKAGQSYGKFSARLAHREKEEIYENYQRLLDRQAKAEEKRLEAKRNGRMGEKSSVRKTRKRAS